MTEPLIFQYAVKIVSGPYDKVEPGQPAPFTRGVYFTTINIHNPWEKPIAYKVKIAEAGEGGEPGRISRWRDYKLPPDGVTEFDSRHFPAIFGRKQPFFDGYFVIEVGWARLDVVAAYTGGPLKEGPLSVMHMERVPHRSVRSYYDPMFP